MQTTLTIIATIFLSFIGLIVLVSLWVLIYGLIKWGELTDDS